MVYGLIKFLMTVALRLYYRRIYVTGLENIADKGPAIIIPNHNSSLMDAAILGVLIKRPLHFFARGDVFKNKFVAGILGKFHMLPVHHHEGRKTLNHNAQSFSEAEDILLKGGIIIFFPEGSSHIDKQLKPLRKGVFRLALNTTARVNYSLNIPLIPAGITYSRPTTWRADVMVHLGTPIKLADYIPGYLLNQSATLLQMSKVAYKAMELQVPNICDASLNDLTVKCTEIAANEFTYHTPHWIQATRKRLDCEKDVYNSLCKQDHDNIAAIHERYNSKLEEFELEDKTLSAGFRFSGWNYIFLLTGIILFPPGFLLNALPILIARKLSVKKVYRQDFFSWIFVVSSLLLYLIWMTLVLTVAGISAWQYAAALFFLIPFTGILTLSYIRHWEKLRQVKKLKRLKKDQPLVFNEIFSLRKTLLEACQSTPSRS